MAKRLKKPSVSDITTLKTDLQAYYSTEQDNFKACEEAYEGTFKIKVADGFEKYIPPTGRAVVDVAVDHYITQHPIVQVPPQKDTEASQQHSDRMEKFYNNILRENITRNVISPIREAAKQLGVYGMFCLKGPWVDERYLEEQHPTFRRFYPFNFRAVNPMFIFPEPSFFWNGDGGVLEVNERTVSEVASEWPGWKPSRGKKPTDKLECIQYVNNDWIAYIADNDFVDGPKPNVYGYVPYEIGFSGMGRITEKPEHLAVGLLLPLIEALKTEASIKSAMKAIVELYAYPRLGSLQDMTGVQLGMGPNSITHLPDGPGSLFEIVSGHIPPDLFSYIRTLSEDVERGSFSKVVYGERPAGVDSGYHQRTLVSEVRLRFGEGVHTLENKLSNVLGKCAYLMENIIPEPISIWGRINKQYYEETIRPQDVKGHYTNYVTLATSTPEEDERISLAGLQLLQAGAISRLLFLEKYLKVGDATAEIRRIMVEGVMAQPEIRAAMSQAAVKDWGMEEFLPQGGETVMAPGQPPEAAIPGEISMPGGMV